MQIKIAITITKRPNIWPERYQSLGSPPVTKRLYLKVKNKSGKTTSRTKMIQRKMISNNMSGSPLVSVVSEEAQ